MPLLSAFGSKLTPSPQYHRTLDIGRSYGGGVCNHLGRGGFEHPEIGLEQIEDQGNGGVDLPS